MKKEKSDGFGSSVEKLLDYPIPLWLGLLVVLVCMCSGLLFGAAVRYYTSGGQKLGNFGPVVDKVASLPNHIKLVFSQIYNQSPQITNEQRFDGQAGFKFNYPSGSRSDLGYVLINRYDGDVGHAVSELWDLNAQQMVHRWNFVIMDDSWSYFKLGSIKAKVSVDVAAVTFRNSHAFLEDDGQLLTHTSPSPIIRINSCSLLSSYTSAGSFHHSIEMDYAGNFWVPTRMEPKSVQIGRQDSFIDDGIALLGTNGDVLFKKSVIQILDDNGLGHLIYGAGVANSDPVHLNDIEPVLTDGKFWKRGDVFLSLRHQSAVLLYRPSANKVIWFKSGPWMHQHDVVILNDHQISVYDNRAALDGVSAWKVRGANELLIYDFKNDEVSSPFKDAFSKLDIRTLTEGRGQMIGNDVWVEETNYGRTLQFSRAGEITWQYVNRAKDAKVYLLNWSRPISRELGDKVRSIVTKEKC